MKTQKIDWKQYTILVPMMAEPHFTLIQSAMQSHGYHLEILGNHGADVIQKGLSYVHNDMCYPALIVIGQFIDALQSGNYDLNKTALLLPQTGGGCRASNYIYLLRKALKRSGLEHIPVLSINAKKLDENTLTIPAGALLQSLKAVLYGDFILSLYNQARSYELHFGDSDVVYNQAVLWLTQQRLGGNLRKNLEKICKMFHHIPRKPIQKPRVGVVGEIYLKYSPLGNNHLEDFLVSKGAEPVVSGLTDFLLYCIKNNLIDGMLYGRKSWMHPFIQCALRMMKQTQTMMVDVILENSNFIPPHTFEQVYAATEGVVNPGIKMGEGWLLSAEISAYIQHGVNNIVCAQPFGCLPNHIVAKGVMANIREKYPNANVIAVDYDPGASAANQENRLSLMLMNAQKKCKSVVR